MPPDNDAINQIVQQLMASEGAPTHDPMLGYRVRKELFPGEQSYFQSNPHVAGMAAETGDVILNPFSPAGVNHKSVAQNEAFRLHLRDNKIDPAFAVTDDQRKAFAGTAYANDDAALRATIAARIYSGDPSAMATDQQRQWVGPFLGRRDSRPNVPTTMGSILGTR